MQNTRRFFIPDFTVGLGFSPSLPVPVGDNRVADLWLTAHYRQWGISPRPETDFLFLSYSVGMKNGKTFYQIFFPPTLYTSGGKLSSVFAQIHCEKTNK